MDEKENEVRIELEKSIKEMCLEFEQKLKDSKQFDEKHILVIRNAYAMGIKKGMEITIALKQAGIELTINGKGTK